MRRKDRQRRRRRRRRIPSWHTRATLLDGWNEGTAAEHAMRRPQFRYLEFQSGQLIFARVADGETADDRRLPWQ